MNVYEHTKEECDTQVTQTIAQLLDDSIKKRGKAVFGICGGRSVEGIFNHLKTANIPWKQVYIMMIDERAVSLNSLESNYRLAHETFIDALIKSKKLPADHVHPFIYNEAHAIKAVLKYHQTLEALGGFDVILASSGEDGHIAALFPKHHSIQKENVGFFLIPDAPKPPPKRITASRKLLLKSKAGIILFYGKEKEKAWKLFNDTAKTIIDCPAKLITQLPESYVFRTKEVHE